MSKKTQVFPQGGVLRSYAVHYLEIRNDSAIRFINARGCPALVTNGPKVRQ